MRLQRVTMSAYATSSGKRPAGRSEKGRGARSGGRGGPPAAAAKRQAAAAPAVARAPSAPVAERQQRQLFVPTGKAADPANFSSVQALTRARWDAVRSNAAAQRRQPMTPKEMPTRAMLLVLAEAGAGARDAPSNPPAPVVAAAARAAHPELFPSRRQVKRVLQTLRAWKWIGWRGRSQGEGDNARAYLTDLGREKAAAAARGDTHHSRLLLEALDVPLDVAQQRAHSPSVWATARPEGQQEQPAS